MKTSDNSSTFTGIGSLIESINAAVKTASVKKADDEASGSGSAAKDPGGYSGGSDHPTAKADGGLQPAKEGFRGKENTTDVKKDVPNSVDGTSETSANADNDATDIGLKNTSTGKDPSIENAYKSKKDDPGTTAEAKTDMGEKYSSMSFPELYETACHVTERLIGRLAAGEKFAAASNAAPAVKAAAVAGQLAATSVEENQIKFAAASEVVAQQIREGYEDADLVGEFLYKSAAYEDNYLKQAEGEDPTGGAMAGAPGMDAGAGGAVPPEMAAALAGGGGGAGMPPGAEGGGAPAPGGEAMGGEGGGGGEEAINELANALIDAGIPPEALIEALSGAAAGGGEAGGAPGGPGGDPTGGGAPPEMGGAKAASARIPKSDAQQLKFAAEQIYSHMSGGRFRLTKPARGSKQAKDREEMRDYFQTVKEVLSI